MATNFEPASMRRSMREKSLERRRVNKEHNSNFRAGFVHIYEEQLHKTGLRGRKRYLAYVFLFLLSLVVIANFIITIMILCVLRIGHTGMETLDFMPSGLLRFVYGGDMGTVYPIDSMIGGYVSQDLELYGDTQPIEMQHQINSKTKGASVSVANNGTKVVANNMHIINPHTNKNIFSTEYSNFRVPEQVKNLNVQKMVTSMVTGGSDDDLTVIADRLSVRGNEGVHLNGKSVVVTAKDNINLTTNMNERVVMNGKNGIKLSLDSLPTVGGNTKKDDIATYKLCVCASTGKVFRVEVMAGEMYACSKLASNPCL
ncbi:beta-sarcoglycan-like [Glandiceps talaboti]